MKKSPLPSPRIKDITGLRFGRLTVTLFAGLYYRKTGGPKAYWRCLCDCGGTLQVLGTALRTGNTQSCGCLHADTARKNRSFIDLTGQHFTLLVALSRIPRLKGRSAWHCRCNCGAERIVLSSALRGGKVKACHACAKKRRVFFATTHGYASTSTWNTWTGMHMRCKNPNELAFPNYGGRGISVDPRWDTFEQFFADMGERPSPQHSLERKDNNGPYSPENCMWATRSQQMRNTRRNVMIMLDGKTKCLTEWAEAYCIPASLVAQRVRTLHWDTKRALTTPSARPKH